MRLRILIVGLLAAALVVPAGLAGPSRTWWWDVSEATLRLETGRFAVRNHVGDAICLGAGSVRVARYGVETYREFECRVYAPGLENERHLVLRVTGRTTFRVEWLGAVAACP